MRLGYPRAHGPGKNVKHVILHLVILWKVLQITVLNMYKVLNLKVSIEILVYGEKCQIIHTLQGRMFILRKRFMIGQRLLKQLLYQISFDSINHSAASTKAAAIN